MRNFKRALALVLAFIMIVGTFATVSATGKTGSVWYDKAVDDLDSMGISDIGNTAAQTLSRNEFVFWIAKIESGSLEDSVWKDEIASVTFNDVNDNHHKAAIAYAHLAEFIIGDGEGNFLPDKELTLGELATVLVRMMRWEHKLTGLDEGWGLNNMRVANTYIHAFTPEFLREVGNYDPNYTPTKGEVAYVLCTIMNRDQISGSVQEDFVGDDLATSLDRDGNNLGARFEGIGGAMVREEMFYVLGPTHATDDNDFAINEVNTDEGIVLVNVDGTSTIIFEDVKEFRKAVRVSLGLSAEPNYAREEEEINLFDYVSIGTLVSIRLDADVAVADNISYVTDYTDVKSLNVETGSVVVNTFLQLKQLVGVDAYSDYLGLYVNSVIDSSYKKDDFTPVLPSAYKAENAATWTNIDKRTGWVEVEPATEETPAVYEKQTIYVSATLNFKGVSYVYNFQNEEVVYYATMKDGKPGNKVTIPASITSRDIANVDGDVAKLLEKFDFLVYGASESESPILSVEEAVKTLISAAQGEAYVVFNDVDGDGIYDNAIVLASDPFDYQDNDAINNSLNDADWVEEPTEAQLGSVTINNKDGKIQLTLAASGAGIDDFIKNIDEENELKDYAVVDLATLYTGVIEEVQIRAASKDHFYKATIRCTDGETRTVWIPTAASVGSKTTNLNVTLGGATATYTFDNSEWFPFLEEAAGIIDDGILGGDNTNVEDVAATAAWMMSKYVQFAIDANNNVIAIYGTDEEEEKAFVVGVNSLGKDETDAAKYEVILATLSDTTSTAEKAEIVSSKTDGFKAEDLSKFFSEADVKKIQTVVKVENAEVEFVSNSGAKYYKSSFGTTEVVENEDGSYSKVTVSLWGDNKDLTKAALFVAVSETYECDAEGVVAEGAVAVVEASKNDNNEWVDAEGNTFALSENRVHEYHVADITKVQVRANASAAWDYEDRALYEALFTEDAVMDEDGTLVNAQTDLIYVTVMKDGGSNYLLAGFDAVVDTEGVEGVVATNKFMGVSYKTNAAQITYPASDDVENDNWSNATGTKNAWDAGKGEDGVSYLLSINEVKGAVRTTFNVAGFAIVDGKVDGKTNFKDEDLVFDETNEFHTSTVIAGYETTYEVRIGHNPQYRRTSTTGGYKYDIEFATVEVFNTLKGLVDFTLDASKLYMSPVYENTNSGASVALKIEKEEDQEKWLKSRDEKDTNVYYFDSEGYAFYLLPGSSVAYKINNDKKNDAVVTNRYVVKSIKYDYETIGATASETIADVAFNPTAATFELTQAELAKLGILKDPSKAYDPNEKKADGKKNDNYNPYIALKPYGNFSAVDADPKTAGYFPGLYTVTINGQKYTATEDTEVVIVSPALKGFDIASTVETNAGAVKIQTLKDIKNEEYFITEWDFDVKDTHKAIVIVGEKVGEVEDTETEETPVVNTDKLVYLPEGAEAYISLGEYADDIRVYSDKSAYLLPSGEEFGAIYRTYPTYKDALDDLQIDLAIADDTFYIVTADREIVKATSNNKKTYEITSVDANGVATIKTPKSSDATKGDAVSMSGVDVKFFYNDVNGVMKVADTNSKLTVLTTDAYMAEIAKLNAAKNKAQTEYNDAKVRYNNGNLAAENFQVYTDALNAAKQAIADYEAKIITENYNGQLWGSANSAIATYYTRAQMSQDARKLNFTGIMIEEGSTKTLIVFTDSLTPKTALK